MNFKGSSSGLSSRYDSEPQTSSGLSKEEEEAAKKKIGWVDEKEAEKRIGTGWYQELVSSEKMSQLRVIKISSNLKELNFQPIQGTTEKRYRV